MSHEFPFDRNELEMMPFCRNGNPAYFINCSAIANTNSTPPLSEKRRFTSGSSRTFSPMTPLFVVIRPAPLKCSTRTTFNMIKDDGVGHGEDISP